MSDKQPSPDPVATPFGFPSLYFDGKTSVRHEIALRVVDHHLVLAGDGGSISVAVSETRLTETSQHGPLLLSFVDGGHCELPSSAAALQQLRSAGVALAPGFGIVSMLERDRRLALLSIGFLAAVVAAFYVWLLPVMAELVAKSVPALIQTQIGQIVLVQMEGRMLQPSRLETAERAIIHQRFDTLLGKQAGQYTLHIRKSKIGPNAFALPGKIVVLTDELVKLVGGDLDAITGVLAHELGHVAHHHGLRNVIQGAALTILGSALIGDYSSVLATLPAAFGQLRYSRAFEAEADLYSHTLLCEKKIDPSKTALFFDKIAARPGNVAELLPDYLKTHAGSATRAEYFRSPC